MSVTRRPTHAYGEPHWPCHWDGFEIERRRGSQMGPKTPATSKAKADFGTCLKAYPPWPTRDGLLSAAPNGSQTISGRL